jgi:glucose/arabinose dehydrogenase
MKKTQLLTSFLPAMVLAGIFLYGPKVRRDFYQSLSTPAVDNAGLKMPAGFTATSFESGTRPRHIAVAPNGLIYLKLNRKNKEGKTILAVKEGSDGQMTTVTAFGDYTGTGIYIKDGYLYTSSDTEVFRYKLNANFEVVNPDAPEKIITGLINRHQHESKSVVLDNAGNIYVNIGAYSNSCQEKDRTPGSMGRKGCPILDSAGGIWQFKADKLNQTYKDGVRYVTGLRNVVGLDWNQQLNQLFVMMHGRDDLHNLFPAYYTEKESAILPAESLYALKKGDNAGWPYIYYDQNQHKKMMAPEYGGDGKKEGSKEYLEPAVAFPGHMAPNGLLFYTGNQFPEKYKNGAFIAFHGSWDRTPEPQAGYFVVFQPFKNGKPAGDWEVFAEGFAGVAEVKTPGQAQHRPCGLAQAPDGSLYVTDDTKGAVYHISYKK